MALLSFSSGLPLGLVWIAIPDWMRRSGADLRVVGLITLAQAPWTFKVLWSPLMDRYTPPWLGRRRGWALLAQVALFASTLALAGLGDHPEAPWVVGALALAIAFASATQDIAVDAYAVDVLRPEEQGVAVGGRIALYRAAMFVAGGLSITAAAQWSWPAVNAGLALLYLPMMAVAVLAPDPEQAPAPPRTLREAVWLPLLGFLAKHRALEILAFVLLYKLADNLSQALLRPFLVDMGYSDFDRGMALASLGLAATLVGTFVGGAITTVLGLGHSLWVFGLLQIFSNLGYILVADGGGNRPLMYAAMSFEHLTTGLGMGAFSVLLLRLTEKRFSATQYALFSSLFGLPRIIAGPVAGFAAHALGWKTFFWATMVAGIPGLLMLARFVPLGVREPVFRAESPPEGPPPAPAAIAVRGLLVGLSATVGGAGVAVLVGALGAARSDPGAGLRFGETAARIAAPAAIGDWLTLVGIAVFGLLSGCVGAAVLAARRGAGTDPGA